MLFQVAYDRDWHIFELPIFVFLGLFGGFYGVAFIKLNILLTKARKTSQYHALFHVLLVAVASSLINYCIHILRAGSGELVANLFRECEEVDTDFHGLCSTENKLNTLLTLCLASLLKFGMTVATFGLLVPSGLFIPSMAIG